MNKTLVTVVLPIYNVEKYLDRCMESIVNQTYTNLEILMIDDGSPDRCPAMCDKWAQKDNRIRVIHKKNAGLGEARNTGIENATGDYICFFDSDDYVRLDTIELLVKQICKEHADLAVFGCSTVSADGQICETFVPLVGYRTYRGEEVLTEFLPDFIAPDYRFQSPRKFYMSAWVLLYSVEMIRKSGWKFVSEREIIAEDVYSLIALMRHVQTVTAVPEALYFYCMNAVSLSRSYRADRYLKIKDFYVKTMEMARNKGYNDDVLHRISKPYLAFTLAALKQEAASDRPYSEKMQTIREIIVDEVLQTVLQQNKKDIVSRSRYIIFFFMRRKWYHICYFLLSARC